MSLAGCVSLKIKIGVFTWLKQFYAHIQDWIYSQTPLFRAPLFRDPPYFADFEDQIFHPDLLQSH